jgi:hypothetical protein
MTADLAATEAAKKQLAADRETLDKSRAEFAERTKGRPTPTQEENDLAMLGAPVFEKSDDGSGPDPNIATRSMEAEKPAQTYQTRTVRPAAPPKASS